MNFDIRVSIYMENRTFRWKKMKSIWLILRNWERFWDFRIGLQHALRILQASSGVLHRAQIWVNHNLPIQYPLTAFFVWKLWVSFLNESYCKFSADFKYINQFEIWCLVPTQLTFPRSEMYRLICANRNSNLPNVTLVCWKFSSDFRYIN